MTWCQDLMISLLYNADADKTLSISDHHHIFVYNVDNKINVIRRFTFSFNEMEFQK